MNINKLFKRILTLSLILSVLITSFPLSVLAETFEAEVTASRMAVREGKTSSTELLGYLEKGTIVTVLNYADGIAYIEFKGKKGYARVSDMKRVSSTEEKAPEKEDEPDHGLATVIEREIPVYEKATSGSKEIGTLKKGATILVLEVDERGWAKIENGDEIAYTRVIYLEIDEDAKATPSPVKNAASGKATVTASSLPIYASASTDSRLMTTLKKGQTFTVLATGNGWAKLQNGSNIGYARLIGLSLSNETPEPTPKPTEKPATSASGIATVKVHSAYVYQEASSGSKKIDIIYRDESFTLLSISGEWAKLQNGNSIGYVKVSNLSISENEDAAPAPTKTIAPTATSKPDKSLSGLGTVNVHSLYVYESASSGAAKLGYIFRGETYTVLATSGEWAKIEDGDRIVYVKLSGLTIDEGAKATPKPENIIGSVTVTVHSKHIYDKASTGATKKGYIFRNNTYPLLEVSGSWVKIKVGDEAVYTTVDDLTINDKTAPTQKPTQKPEESLSGIAEVKVNSAYVYASPSDDSRRMCQIYKGEKYTLLSTSNGWAKLQNGSSIGYVELENLSIKEGAEATPVPTSTPIPVPNVIEGPVAEVNVTKMYVYAGKSVSAESLGSLSKGSTVTILESDGTWAKIYKDNKVGFCKYASLKLTGEYEGKTPAPTAAATPAPTAPIQAIMEVDSFVNTSSAKIYAGVTTSSTVLKSVSAGYEVTVLGVSGDWAYVEYGSNRGYMLKETLIAKKDATLTANMESPAVISASSLTVYKFASTYAPSYGKFGKGTEVTVLAYKDGWAMLKRGDAIGYADAEGISIVSNEKNPTLPATTRLPAFIKSDRTKAYANATESSKIIGYYAAASEVTVLGYNDTWCLIEKTVHSGNVNAYVLKSNVLLVSDYELAPKGSYPGVVTASSASVYKYASEYAPNIGSLKKGATFNVLAQGNGWAFIELNGNRGYMKLSNMYVQMDEFTSPTVKSLTATVIKDNLPAYSCALENGDYKVGSLKIGDTANVTAYTDKWARVNVNGENMYVLKKYLSNATYTALSASSGSKTEINKLQKALEDLGYFDGNPAGNYGSLTTAAVQRFQKQLGLTVTGNADLATLRILYSAEAPESSIRTKTLSRNDTGSDVTRLQNRLTYKGYMNDSIDGDYGPITENAVKIYQKVAGLTETGTADSKTLKSLFSSSAPTNNSGNVAGSGSNTGSGNGNYSTDPDDDLGSGTASEKAETVIDWGLQQLGKKYVYGDEGPNTFDCSGFTQYCYAKVGVKLRRSAQAVGYNDGTKITNVSDLRRGDIVCFNTIDDSDLSDHVGIYLGNNQFVHASSGAGKVVISSLASGYYLRVFSWGRRVL